jgi:hypothetical protein
MDNRPHFSGRTGPPHPAKTRDHAQAKPQKTHHTPRGFFAGQDKAGAVIFVAILCQYGAKCAPDAPNSSNKINHLPCLQHPIG